MNAHLNIIENVRQRIAAAGISPTEAAKRAGIATTTLTRPLNDPDHPFTLSTTTLEALAAALECTLADLTTSFCEPDTLGSTLRSARVAKRMKQHEVASALDVTVQAVSQWERGENQPTGLNLLKLGALLGIEIVPTYLVDLTRLATEHSGENIPAQNNKLTDLRDEIETAYDLMTALDKAGDGIGGDVGHGVSAVALAARAALDNARDMIRAMEASR